MININNMKLDQLLDQRKLAKGQRGHAERTGCRVKAGTDRAEAQKREDKRWIQTKMERDLFDQKTVASEIVNIWFLFWNLWPALTG